MENVFETNSRESDYLSAYNGARLLWEWRKYRNQVLWSSVYRWGAVCLAIMIAPYLLPDLSMKLGMAVFVFPLTTFLLACFAAYLIAVQYKLYKQIDRKYRSCLGPYKPEDLPRNNFINKALQTSFGLILPGGFLCLALLQILSVFVLFNLVNKVLP